MSRSRFAFLFVFLLGGTLSTDRLPARGSASARELRSNVEVDPVFLQALLDRYQPRRQTFRFGLIGDTQYSAQEQMEFLNLMRVLDRQQLAFIVHNGDFKSGASPCTDEVFRDRLQLFDASQNPLVFTPGDNEWTDCWTSSAGSYDPLERLARLRELFFANPYESLGQRRVPVFSQADDPQFSLYRENLVWALGPVVFATVHVVGSNNNRGRTPEMDREYEARNAANLAWIRTAFSLARDGGFAGIMVIMQANPRFDLSPGDPGRSGFNETLAVLEEETLAFGKPTVLVHGDTHYFRIDKPLVGTRSRRRVEWFTRLETFGSPDVHWVRARVEPRNPNLFAFEQGIIQKHLVAH